MLWKMIGNEKQYILSKFLGQLKVLNTHTFIKCCMRHLYISLMHLICPPPTRFCITFVFHFSWVLQPSQKKGALWKMCKWRMSSWVWTLSPDGPSRERILSFFSAKNISKVAIIKTKSAKFLFLFSSFLPCSFFFSLLFWSFSGSKNPPFRTLFHSNDYKFRQVGFKKIS